MCIFFGLIDARKIRFEDNLIYDYLIVVREQVVVFYYEIYPYLKVIWIISMKERGLLR
jgi:hypothetical protein